MRSFSRAEKGFLFGLIATPLSILFLFFHDSLPYFLNMFFGFLGILGLGLFAIGGLITVLDSNETNELEEAYRSQQ